MDLAPQLPSKSCLALATDLDLPACYSIRRATTAADYESFSHLARAYHRELPVDLGFQAIDKELGSLPGCYSSPTGIILLLSHQPHSNQTALDVGCAAFRPLITNRPATKQAAAGETDVVIDDRAAIQLSNTDSFKQSKIESDVASAAAAAAEAPAGPLNPPKSSTPTGSQCTDELEFPHLGSAAAAAAAAAAVPADPTGLQNPEESPHLSSTCELKRLWVSGDHSGGGLGKALATAAMSAARCCGYKHMVLETLERLTAANKVYEGLGFVLRGPYYDNPLPDAVYYQVEL